MEGFRTFILAESAAVLASHGDIDAAIVQLYRSGNKVKQIEETTGKWRSYIYEVLRREGILPYRLNQQRELTIQLAGSGVSARKIAEITSQTERNVRGIIAKQRNQHSHAAAEWFPHPEGLLH